MDQYDNGSNGPAQHAQRLGQRNRPGRVAATVLVTLLTSLIWSVLPGAETVYAAAPTAASYQQEPAPEDAGVEYTLRGNVVHATGAESAALQSPRDCIDPLMAGHIAATLASLAPIPGFADAADAAAYALNIALKHCPPDLSPPPPIVVQQPSQGCVHRLALPVPLSYENLVRMDQIILEEIIEDPSFNPTPQELAELTLEIDNKYGRFDNLAYGYYSNVYGIPLPIRLSEFAVPHWGDIGAPKVFHYNSDVEIEMTFPGKRISPELIEVPVGSHQVVWKGDTFISKFDYAPLFLFSSAYRYYKAAQAKAQKRFAIDGTKVAVKKQIEEVLKKGNRYFAEQVAKEVATNVLTTGATIGGTIVYKNSTYEAAGDPTGATTIAYQPLTVIDPNPPQINGVKPVVVEAFDPGGIQSGRKINELMAAITVTDDCDPDPTLTYVTPRFWPIQVDANGNPLPSAEIIWRASDNGAASASGGVNTTEVRQQITVQDTLAPILVPPPPVMMYAQNGETVEVPLGAPEVFDVVDLRPDIQYSAPGSTPGAQWPVFDRGVHYVTWTATDQSRNQSEPQQQLVNIKAPGTNNTPTATPQTGPNTVEAIADEAVRIVVRGNDPDVDGSGMRDPIWFRVDRQPKNGFFIAPLYPYFIDDYRMTARYSPWIAARDGEAKALEVAQDPNLMRDYIKALCAEDINRTDLPKDFISFSGGSQKYIAVDDDGYTYIYDNAYRKCTPGGSTIAPYTTPRISVWDQQGRYVGEQERNQSSGGRPLRDVKFNVGRGTIITTESDGSTTGNSLVNISSIQPENKDEPIVDVRSYALWNKVNNIYIASEDVTRTPEYKNATAAAFDNTTGVLYVIGETNLRGMSAFQPAPCNQGGGTGPEDCLNYVGSQIYSLPIIQSTKWDDFPGLDTDAMRLQNLGDIALDSKGNVYVVAKVTNGFRYDRIYKYAPAVKHPDGSITLGDFIGWMGKCDSGVNCNYIEQRSIGFSCTDDTCAFEGDSFGSRPGQFGGIGAIAVDPNDVLYVADTANQRVQRFSPEGYFAGEARSQSTCEGCSGFVLGDFGSPGNIAVNSGNFYILDIDEELVHVFETSVIHSIDDKSAWIEYQSDSNYVGPDSFTFRATDGFLNASGKLVESAPAEVAVNVKRNFRPPVAEDGWATTGEESPVAVTLTAYDLDRELDTLAYAISFQPQYGSLSGNPPNMTYTPGPDFAGTDAFQFTVSDGRFTSDPATFTVEVTPVNDTPVIQPESSSLQTGLGHPTTLKAAILDPDEGDELTAVVDWGDGTRETIDNLSNPGNMNEPSLTPLVNGRADLVAYHTYGSAGSYTINIETTDKEGAKATAQVQVNVAVMADIVLRRSAQPLSPAGQEQISYELTVRNQRSPSGDGAAAGGISVSEIITGQATFNAAIASSGNCQVQPKRFECELGNLNPDEETKVTVQLKVAGGAAPGAVLNLDAEAASNAQDPLPENNRDRFDLALVPNGDFYVNSQRDGVDISPGDGVCATSEGDCTVRAAIMEANAGGGAQTIVLGVGIHVLEGAAGAASAGADDAASGDLDIDSDITLLGVDAQQTTLHANAIDRVLEIHGGTVRLEDLAISGGDAGTNADGGGILNDGGNVRLQRVTVDGNRAVNGGGIRNASGQMNVLQSSIIQNTAQSSGGGILNQANLTLENVTISGNQADGGGGLAGVGGNAQLLHVTLADNSASNAGGGINSTGNAVRIENSLLAGNNAAIGPDCAPQLVSGGNNLIGTRQDCNVSGSSGSDVAGQSPKIDAITVNPAQTYSHPLLQGSPAVGLAPCVLKVDQSNAERPEADCDAGAYEAGAFPANEFVLLPVIQHR